MQLITQIMHTKVLRLDCGSTRIGQEYRNISVTLYK